MSIRYHDKTFNFWGPYTTAKTSGCFGEFMRNHVFGLALMLDHHSHTCEGSGLLSGRCPWGLAAAVEWTLCFPVSLDAAASAFWLQDPLGQRLAIPHVHFPFTLALTFGVTLISLATVPESTVSISICQAFPGIKIGIVACRNFWISL